MSTQLHLRPMTADQFERWHQQRRSSMIAHQTSAGFDPDVAAERDDRDFERMLPQGLETPGEHLAHIVRDDTEVGHVWVRMRRRSTGVEAFVHDFSVSRDDPRLASGALALVEQASGHTGASWIRLNAAGGTEAPYRERGYAPARYRLTGSLDKVLGSDLGTFPTVLLKQMNQDEFDAYVEQVRADETANRVGSGLAPEQEAAEAGERSAAAMRAQAEAGNQNFIGVYTEDNSMVGRVWLRVDSRGSRLHSVGQNLGVLPEHRGRGYGRAILAALRQMHRDQEIASTSFKLYGTHQRAKELLTRLGCEITQVQLRKELAGVR